jgi:septation ring formation regulator EzrA
MAEVSSELIYEVLKRVQDQLVNLNDGQRDIREELRALRGHSLAMQTDVHNIYNILNSLEGRVDRIERRLELRDDAAE